MRRLATVSLVTICLVALYPARPAQAQGTHSIELSGGLNAPMAWYGSVTKNLTDSVGVIGEVNGHSETVGIPGLAAATVRTHWFLAGPRFAGGRTARLVPFAQMLFGAVRISSKVDVLGLVVNTSLTEFALQPGVGVDVMLTDRVGVRLQGDYRRILAGTGGASDFRIAVGAVFGVG